MEITMDIPDDLAVRLQSRRDQLPQIAEEIIDLRPSDELQKRIDALLEKNRAGGLQPAEEREWAHYEYLEHIVRLAKANAALKQKTK